MSGLPVHFVGAGPGAAELLTLRAAALLAHADVVLYPGSYLDPQMLEQCSGAAELVDTAEMNLDAIVERLISAQRAGRAVVRLVSGDPSLYSAVFEQTRRLDASGVPWEITPGVPAYAAAAAVLGRELTVPLVTQSVVLTRVQAASTAMPQREALGAFAATQATLVVHLAITRIAELMAELAGEYGPDCPVAVVYRASQPDELVLRGTISDIAEAVTRAGLRSAAVILVGRAVGPAHDSCGGESHLYDPDRCRDHHSD